MVGPDLPRKFSSLFVPHIERCNLEALLELGAITLPGVEAAPSAPQATGAPARAHSEDQGS